MTIKLGNLHDWRVLEGASLAFVAPDYDKSTPRRRRLDLNSEVGCNWYIRFQRVPILNMPEYVIGHEPVLGKPEQVERFFAFVPAGLETVEFTFAGDFELMPVRPDDAEILYWTSEAEEFWTEGDGETFSTIYERQPRNEALEWVMFQSAQNQLRRDKAHAAELEAIRAEIGALKNEGQSGIHGGPPAADQKPAGELGGKGRKSAAAKAAVNDAVGEPPNRKAAANPAPENLGADGSLEGEDTE